MLTLLKPSEIHNHLTTNLSTSPFIISTLGDLICSSENGLVKIHNHTIHWSNKENPLYVYHTWLQSDTFKAGNFLYDRILYSINLTEEGALEEIKNLADFNEYKKTSNTTWMYVKGKTIYQINIEKDLVKP